MSPKSASAATSRACVLGLLLLSSCGGGVEGTADEPDARLQPSAPSRPAPGEVLRAPTFELAAAGTFDVNQEIAITTRRTRRGYEAAYIKVRGGEGERALLYSIPTGIVKEVASADAPEWERVAPDGPSPVTEGVPEACVCGPRRRKGSFDKGRFRFAPLREGAVYAAKTEAGRVSLVVHALAEDKPRVYGPLVTCDGRRMDRALAITTTGINDVIIVGTVDGNLHVAHVEDVFIDEILDARLAAAREHFAKDLETPVPGRSYSISGFSNHLDRPFDSMAVLSDGKVYFGTMPHHPTKGSYIFRYDPATERVENLGDIDVLSGEKDEGDIPGMMHAPPVEAHGYALFVGQDPFYGHGHEFPELPDDAKYPGSHLLGYHMATGTWKDFGIVKEGASIFWVAALPDNDWVYCREGYHAGPMHRVNIVTGEVERDLFRCPANRIETGDDGAVYYSRKGKTYRWDPDSRVVEECSGGGRVFGLPRTSRISYRVRRGGRGQGSNRAARIERIDHDTGERTDLGVAVDQDGRLCQIAFASATGPDGTVYFAGPFFAKAGDAYSPRLKPYFLNECRFMVVKVTR